MRLKVSFGAGGRKIDGWRCTDIAEIDITKPLPFGDHSLDAAFSSHVCEHISGPDFLRFLTEIHRVLFAGAWYRLTIPLVGPWLQRDHARDLMTNHGHLAAYNEELVRTYLWAAGFDQQNIRRTGRSDIDHHYLEIGDEKDQIESGYFIAIK